MSQDIEYEKNDLEEAINHMRNKYLKEIGRHQQCCDFSQIKIKLNKILKNTNKNILWSKYPKHTVKKNQSSLCEN